MNPLLAAVTARGLGVPATPVPDLGPSARTADGAIVAAVVGTLTNARMVRALLQAKGYALDDVHAPDAELVAHLVHDSYKKGLLLFHAVRQAAAALSGDYALVATALAEPECLVVAQRGSPLVIGVGGGTQAVASAEDALPETLRRCIHLEPGDVAELRGNDIVIVDGAGLAVLRRLRARVGPAQAA